MKKSKFSDPKIAFALQQAETGMPVADACRKLGMSEATFYCWTLVVAIDGSKFKAVNNRDRNFTAAKMQRRMAQIEESIARYQPFGPVLFRNSLSNERRVPAIELRFPVSQRTGGVGQRRPFAVGGEIGANV